MTRSVWKGPFVDITLMKKADKLSQSGRKEVIKTWSRRSTIFLNLLALHLEFIMAKNLCL